MKKLMIVLCLLATPAAAHAACDEDTLETVSDGGETLVMQSGHVYRVNGGDTVDTQLWLAAEDVLVCDGDEIINKEENGEKASDYSGRGAVHVQRHDARIRLPGRNPSVWWFRLAPRGRRLLVSPD